MLDQTAKRYAVRPSDLLKSTWFDYQMDMAVALLGRYVDNKLSERDPKTGKPKYTVQQILSGQNSGMAGLIGMFLASGSDDMYF